MRNRDVVRSAKKGKIVSLRLLWSYMARYRVSVCGVLLALMASSGSVLSLGVGLRHLVDGGFTEKNADVLDHALGFMLVAISVLTVSTYLRFTLIATVGERIIADMRRDLYKHLLSLSPGFFEQAKIGEVISRLTNDAQVMQVVVASTVSVAMRNLLLLVGGIGMLIYTSPQLALVSGVVIPLIVVPILVIGKRVRKFARTSQDKLAGIASQVGETLRGIRIVQAYGQEEREYDMFVGRVNETLSAAITRIRMRGVLTAFVIFFVFSAIGVVLWVGGHDVIEGALTTGQLSSFIFYSLIVAGAFGALSEAYGDLQHAAGAAEGIFELLGATPHVAQAENPVPLGAVAGNIVFDNVSFSYPARPEATALSHVSFDVKAGEHVAIVGPSGAGKSTILQLLLRFYDTTGGRITLDGKDISQLDLAELRAQFAYISQEAVIFSVSALENIRYARPDASMEEVLEAAKAARADEFISRLPQGYDTYLGEQGAQISGGERQRIALARAFLRKPKILLLDEATNALDAENEHLVQEALERLMQGTTTLVIAHRLRTVLASDKIIVMEQGGIDSVGTHRELVAKGELYARLADIQLVA